MFSGRNGSKGTNTLLEGVKVVLSEGIGLSNDRDEVDTRSQTLHDLDIERLQATEADASIHRHFHQ